MLYPKLFPSYWKGCPPVAPTPPLVCEYYDGFSFGAFVRKYPHHKGNLTDLLIGNLFNEEVAEVFGPMEQMQAEMAAADA